MRTAFLGLSLALAALPSCGNAQSQGALISDLKLLASQENAEAIYHLGMAFHTGSGVKKDREKALEYFRKATDLGDPLAAYKLGCYYDGQGYGLVDDDLDLALQHKMVAAEAGYALAQQDVASLLARRGDFESAVVWLERAVDQGWTDAIATYASIHNGAKGVTKDPVKVAAYFRIFISRTDGSANQRRWLKEFEQGLTDEELQATKLIVQSFEPTPSGLTLKALAGQRSAELLVTKRTKT